MDQPRDIGINYCGLSMIGKGYHLHLQQGSGQNPFNMMSN